MTAALSFFAQNQVSHFQDRLEQEINLATFCLRGEISRDGAHENISGASNKLLTTMQIKFI